MSVAVVVQKMIAAEVAGVCFTVHPVTQDENQMLIESCWGLGESLVQGLVTPDSYIVEKNTGTILDTNVNFQEHMMTRDVAGTQTIDVPLAKQKNRNSQNMRYKSLLTCASR